MTILETHLLDSLLYPRALDFKEFERSYGYPITCHEIVRPGYALGYNAQSKLAYWVVEHVTPHHIAGEAKRKNIFLEDPAVRSCFRATTQDYSGSGYDRGHLAPCANFRHSQEQTDESFFLTNIAPQTPAFNRGIWLKLESQVRKWTALFPHQYVISGPLFLPKNGTVTYPVIGASAVAVPTHFFKVILGKRSDSSTEVQAFLLPNEAIPISSDLSIFRISLQTLEEKSGLKFFPRVDTSKLDRLSTIWQET